MKVYESIKWLVSTIFSQITHRGGTVLRVFGEVLSTILAIVILILLVVTTGGLALTQGIFGETKAVNETDKPKDIREVPEVCYCSSTPDRA
jgi:uncharacterized membrane protein